MELGTLNAFDVSHDRIFREIYQTVHNHEGGINQLAQELVDEAYFESINIGTFTNKVSPTSERHALNLNEFLHIVEVTKNMSALHLLTRNYDYLMVEKAQDSLLCSTTLFTLFAEWEIEQAETIEHVKKALKNGIPSNQHIQTLKDEIYQDFQKEIAIIQLLRNYREAQNGTEYDQVLSFSERLSAFYQTLENAIHQSPLGADSLATEISPRPRVFLKKCDAENESLFLSVREFLNTLKILPAGPILEALARLFQQQLYPIKIHSYPLENDIFDLYTDWELKQAETVRKIKLALDDGILTKQEYQQIESEAFRDFGMEMSLLKLLESLRNK